MSLRALFFGTPAFAVPSLERLVGAGHDVAAVVTQPDRPKGRTHQITAPPVKVRALDQEIPVLQPAAMREAGLVDRLREFRADIAIVAAYGHILPQTVLDLPRLGFLNVHASLLPRWRGAAPVHRAILAGDPESGVTIMKVVLALDAGPMLARARTHIDPNETSVDLERRLADLGGTLLVETLDQLERGAAQFVAQDEAAATYAPKLARTDAVVNWSRSATDIHNQIRGLHPWPQAETRHQGRRLLLLDSRVYPGRLASAVPGTVTVLGRSLLVACGEGHVEVREVQPESGRRMPAWAFLRGHQLVTGDTFEVASSRPPT